MAMDFEANTGDAYDPELYVRCISFANDEAVVAIDFEAGGTPEQFTEFKQWLVEQQMIAHNTKYDFGVIYAKTGKLVLPYADTFGAFGHLANDEKRSWGLKAAQVDILGWSSKGDAELDDYKKKNGFTWQDIKKFDFSVLGKYNCLDTDSTWQLYKHMAKVTDSYPEWGSYFWEAHRQDYLSEVLLQIEAQFEGIELDVDSLVSYDQELGIRIEEALERFMTHPDIGPHIQFYNDQVVDKERSKNKPQFTKDGEVSKNWVKWQEKIKRMEASNHFNINSPPQLKWLFYTRMGIEPTRFSEKTGEPSCDKKALGEMGAVGGLLLKYRELVTTRKFTTQLINVNKGGMFYPNVILPATITGRAASKETIQGD